MKKWFPKWNDVRGSDQVILQSGKRLIMENCKKVIHCDPQRIELFGKFRVSVEGTGLKMLELGNENVEIRGAIRNITLGETK